MTDALYANGVRQEVTHWRDARISQRHRAWGYNVPGVDLDFPMVEYSKGLPVALVEYKTIGATLPNLSSPTMRALRTLADNSRIPFIVSQYDAAGGWWFRVTAVNNAAFRIYGREAVMSEREYVTSLYQMRGLPVPHDLLQTLNQVKP